MGERGASPRVTWPSQEKKLPGFSQLESTSIDFDGQGPGGVDSRWSDRGCHFSLMLQRFAALLFLPLLLLLPVLTHVNAVEVMTKWALDSVPIYHLPSTTHHLTSGAPSDPQSFDVAGVVCC